MKSQFWWKLLFLTTLVQMLFTLGIAFGFDVPADITNEHAQSGFEAFTRAIVTGDYWACVGPALLIVVWAVKKWDQDIPRIGPAVSKFMDNPLVSYATPFVLSMGAGLSTSLAAGIPFKEALPATFKIAMEAITLYVGGKKFAEQRAAGQAAAAAVVDGGKAAAVEELKKP